MVLGGSQGAHRVNELASEAIIRYKKDIHCQLKVIHQTGAADEQMVRDRYAAAGVKAQVSAFFTDMAACYAQADLLISRAGATTLAELAVLGKPAILIPYPYAADNHQEKNGRQYVQGGGAMMMIEKDLTGHGLADAIGRLAGDPARTEKNGREDAGACLPAGGGNHSRRLPAVDSRVPDGRKKQLEFVNIQCIKKINISILSALAGSG